MSSSSPSCSRRPTATRSSNSCPLPSPRRRPSPSRPGRAVAVDPAPLSGWQDDGAPSRTVRARGRTAPDAAERLLDLALPSSAGAGAETSSWEERVGEGQPSLHAHALSEIAEVFSHPQERTLAETWFADLDASGFLFADLALPEAAIALLPRLQDEAEPAGLFARSLEECLSIQLRRRDRLDPVMACVLAHLPLLARRDFAALSRLTGESEAELLDILTEIRSLDPRPGSGFSLEAPAAVVPDALVVRDGVEPGGWRVSLNPDAFPRLRVRLENGESFGSGEERAFLAQCRQSASWLQRSLEGRARTILKVAEEIVRRQGPASSMAAGIFGR